MTGPDPKVVLVGGAFVWQSGLAVDADGSPRAYHPDTEKGLDYLACAGRPGRWWGLACQESGAPFVQGPDDPAPGFYVSTTSLVDHAYPASDPRRYVDAEKVPYVTCTRDMFHRGCRLGDLAVVLTPDRLVAAVVADVGPHPGEGSIALAKALGIPSDPRHGGVDRGVRFVLFKDTARGWPRDLADVDEKAVEAFQAWGGPERLRRELGGPAAPLVASR